MLGIITVGNQFVPEITDTMASLFTDFSGLITLVVGVLLGMVIIGWLISLLKH